ncbi:MAG: hypothetical protein ACYC63_16880 [Armatimonadota bacterium]
MAAKPEECPFHLQVAGDVARHQIWIGDLQREQTHHVSNEDGEGHVTRAEFKALCLAVGEMRGWIIKAAFAVLLAAATGSAIGPAIVKAIPIILGKL